MPISFMIAWIRVDPPATAQPTLTDSTSVISTKMPCDKNQPATAPSTATIKATINLNNPPMSDRKDVIMPVTATTPNENAFMVAKCSPKMVPTNWLTPLSGDNWKAKMVLT